MTEEEFQILARLHAGLGVAPTYTHTAAMLGLHTKKLVAWDCTSSKPGWYRVLTDAGRAALEQEMRGGQ